MTESERFDVVVVGGGLAGAACAWEAARVGRSVALFERGEEPGAKNVSGGRLYLGPLAGLLPDAWSEAPLERLVSRETLTLVSGGAAVSFDLRSDKLSDPANASHTVLRATLDRWLGERAAEAGAMVVPGARVDGLVRRDGVVTGVRLGEETIEAGLVVLADGAMSRVARDDEPPPAPAPAHMALGVKEIVALDAARIEDRFGLEPGRGAARLAVGDFSRGIPGGGFLYTNRNSVSVGVVIRLDALAVAGSGGPEAHAVLDAFRAVPEIARLLAGGETIEYAAHLVPERSFDELPPWSAPGLLVAGDAAGFVVNHGFTVRGMDLAIASGVFAGRAAAGEPAAAPAAYETALAESFVLRDLRAARRSQRFLARERLYGHYPRVACELFEELFRFGPGGKGPVGKSAWKLLRKGVLNGRGLRDLWAARKL
jgi:electron transfer flavoprotein-quinone oxidoreductase